MVEQDLFFPLALLPTLAFLVLLDQLDSFRLVSMKVLLRALAAGAALAAVAFAVNTLLIDLLRIDRSIYAGFGAPVVEEVLKATYMILLFQRMRVGFLIDAAILGFAVGAGFSLAENLYYFHTAVGPTPELWLVRGFGTAMMHGGATAVFAILSQSFTERHTRGSFLDYLPGLCAAIAMHALFNQLVSMPILAMGAALLLVPVVIFSVFAKSEHGVHDYLKAGHDLHERVLLSLDDGFISSPQGRLVADIVSRFKGTNLSDVIEYVRVHTELVLEAEEIHLARETGVKRPPRHDMHDRFRRLHELEKAIGRTALLALWPHLKFSRQEMAELY
jgi:RsiW-degrading membrane proteinase PrsW (M82 family)